MNNLTAAIIGGGKSTRFGKPKSFARFKGRRLIEYSIDLAKSISPQLILVSDSHLNYKKYKLDTYHDIIPGCGPLCGVYTALYHANTDYIATVPVDMPILTAEIYKILITKLENNKPVVAISESGMEPLVTIWPRTALNTLKQEIDKKRFSLYKALRRLKAIHVFIPGEMENYKTEYFHNINYQQDMEFNITGENIMDKKLPEHFTEFQKSYPDLAKIHEQLGEITKGAGPLDGKNIRLVKIAMAIGGGHEGAVHSHTRQALDEGISEDEIRHVAVLAIPTVGFPRAMAGLSWINDEVKAI